MKKSILIICTTVITLSVIAFCVLNRNKKEVNVSKDLAINSTQTDKKEPEVFEDFIYDVGTRFRPIKKSALKKIKSFEAFLDQEVVDGIIDVESVSVVIFKDEKYSEIQEQAKTPLFNVNQLKLLQNSDYSTNFKISVYFTEKNTETNAIQTNHWTPHHTIVPEKQAEYSKGKAVLLNFLRTKGKAIVASEKVEPKKLQAAKLFFTVSKIGDIKSVRLDRSSNYPKIDDFMIQLIKNTPDQWVPAENEKGEKVEQELVVSFGLMGC